MMSQPLALTSFLPSDLPGSSISFYAVSWLYDISVLCMQPSSRPRSRNGKIDNCTIASAPLGIEPNNEYLTRQQFCGLRNMWNSRIAGSRLFRSSRLDEDIFWIRKHCIVPLDNGLHILLYFPHFSYVDRFQPERCYEQNTQDSIPRSTEHSWSMSTFHSVMVQDKQSQVLSHVSSHVPC